MYTIEIKTTARQQMIDITNLISKRIEEDGIQDGYAIIFVPHTTAAITINENADPDVKQDMLSGLSSISPNNPSYRHYEGNSDAHIKSSMIGVDQLVIIEHGRLALGTWQGLYFCEFDGPRTRRVQMKFISTN